LFVVELLVFLMFVECLNKQETGWDVVDWINLADDKDQWRALENTVIYLYVP
jgi:hypothetical protein